MAGWLLLFALTTMAAIAALGVTVRAKPAGRAEAGVLFTALLFSVIVTPVFGLGYTNRLRPWLLVLASLAFSLAVLSASARGRTPTEHARDIRRLAIGLLRLPLDAFRETARARSFALLGLAAAVFSILFSAWLSYLAPSESWDGFFYHEPIVGFALQNHGFRFVELPPLMVVQGTNGYPRLCEALALWLVVFTDKTLIELGNNLAAPGLMLAVFVLARRFCADRVIAMGWASAVLLMPAMNSQLRTPMIDVEVAFFLVAALYYATRPALTLTDGLAATLLLALTVGSKSSALVWVPPLALVAYGRLAWAHGRAQPARVAAIIGGGSALLAGVGALTFVRNWFAFGNPLWPVTYSIPWLGIDWKGLATLEQVSREPPFWEGLAIEYHFPTGNVRDIIERDYGYGIPWVVAPLAAISLLFAIGTAIRQRMRRAPDRSAENLLLLVALAALFVKVTPNLSNARYNVHVVVVAILCVCWAASALRDSLRLHEGAVAATLVFTIVAYYWTGYLWGLELGMKEIREWTRHSAVERASMNVAQFQMPAEVARQREQELGPGDLVVFTQELSFPGVLWNHRMSNRLEYLEYREEGRFLAALAERRPEWVVVGSRNKGRKALESRPDEYELIGPACRQDHTVAFRRRAP